jgi:hypothetical protein
MSIHPRDAYATRVQTHAAIHEAARSRSSRLSNVRLVVFLATAAALLAYDVLGGGAESVALGIAALLAVVFMAQVVVHRKVRRVERWEDALTGVWREGLVRLDRDWDALAESLPEAERADPAPDPAHPYALDLDVVGKASLVRLAGPVTSDRGRRILRSWLFEQGKPADALARQGAVRELASRPDLRTEFTAHGRLEGPDALEGIETFLTWAEDDSWILSRTWVRVAAWVLPVTVLATILGDVFLQFPPWWLIPGLAQLEIFRRVMPRAQSTMTQAAVGGAPLRALVPQLRLLAEQDWIDPLLLSLEERLGRGEGASHRHLERLSKLLDTVESRRNMFYVVFALVLLSDVHLGVLLDRWRVAHGAVVRDWLDAAGEWEALSSLGALTHDHPDWAFPTFLEQEEEPLLSGRALGHPLLPPARCVRNDVLVGPPGTFLLVTGSNMSGKSTLLRALGSNVVLALAGGPVCAAELSLPPVRVHTSMRIDDSLSEGISLFMAELLRIREIVRAASKEERREAPRVLFLLDEILHGTNTAERRVAARGVVRHLLGSGAIGAVSTHDLTLADAPDLKRAAVAVNFREQVQPAQRGEGTHLTFDYRLRAGIATTRNALKLLEAVGLDGLELDEEEV